MRKLKALSSLLLIGICVIVMYGFIGELQQAKLSGRTVLSGNAELMEPPTASCTGTNTAGNILVDDGLGGCVDSGEYLGINTFNHCPTITYSGKTCPIFPDNNFWNTDVSGYPIASTSNAYTQSAFPNVTKTFTGAIWAGGTATVTVGSTSGITNGASYPISGAISANCLTGGDCGFNSQVATLGGTGAVYTVTVLNGTTISYSLTGDPGAWVSGGTIWLSTPVLFHHVPEMYLNLADNSTTTLNSSNATWDNSQLASDAGPYPWTSLFLISTYHNTVGGGYVTPYVTTATSYPGEDRHVLSVNIDTCMEYETYYLQNDSSPWHNSNGAIWNLRSNYLRTNGKYQWYGNDSAGLTSADVAGMDIWAGTLTYAEVYSGQPIRHAVRIGLPGGAGGGGIVWPATHTGNNTIPLGIRWILSSSFDGTTCHFRDCAGLAYPAYMQRIITALKTYGAVFTDTGGAFAGISSDASSSWGATDDPSSPTYVLSGWIKSIMWQNGNIVDPTIHVVGITSGALK